MIYTSKGINPFIFHQKKITNIINVFLNSVSPDLFKTNPILSGSYILKLMVRPEADFNDYDLYFSNQEDYNKAKDILLNICLDKKESKNCISFSLPDLDKQIQIINTFSLPSDIIANHDFANSMACWQSGNIFFHLDFFSSWKYNTLIIKNKQFKFDDKNNYVIDNSWLAKYCILVSRIDKYVKRYNLSLNPESKIILNELHSLLQANKQHFATFDFSLIKSNNFNKFIYSIDSNILSISSIENLIQTTLDLIGVSNEANLPES